MAAESVRRSAQMGGVSLKYWSLITLTFQNSALILIMHYSRIMPLAGGQRYYTSTAVFLNEVIKLGISLTMALYDMSRRVPSSTPATTLFHTLFGQIFTGDSWKLAIPAMLYTLQNTLQYVAVSNLDAATFQVTYQLKILTTALFSVILLGRSLSGRKWASLILLMLGVAIVQLPSDAEVITFTSLKDVESKLYHLPRTVEQLRDAGSKAAGQLMQRAVLFGSEIVKRSGSYEGIEEDRGYTRPAFNASLGVVAVFIACMLSGLAGVYFEKVLKDSSVKTSLWVRNVQLSFYSLFPSFFIGVVFKDGERISKTGFFTGYNWVVWSAIACQALGGVIVAMVVNYADNIAKNFATSISIVFSLIASAFFFDLKITPKFVIGTAVVLAATYLYSSTDRTKKPVSVKIAPYEKTTIGGSASYFDEPAPVLPRTPQPIEGISTVTPGTPGEERFPARASSASYFNSKRSD